MPRSRSRSPTSRHPHQPRIDRGLKWKDAPSRTDAERSRHDKDDDDAARRRRRRKDKERHARPDPDRAPREDTRRRIDDARNTHSSPPATTPAPHATSNDGLDIARKFGPVAAAKVKPIPTTATTDGADAEADAMAVRAGSSRSGGAAASSGGAKAPSGPMMLVTVNDRLGTKKEVPCLGADTIGDFKKLVAMQIGRKPHEIMLKRQSERPLKDHLTLDDYEISSGVQLDLELNTGD